MEPNRFVRSSTAREIMQIDVSKRTGRRQYLAIGSKEKVALVRKRFGTAPDGHFLLRRLVTVGVKERGSSTKLVDVHYGSH